MKIIHDFLQNRKIQRIVLILFFLLLLVWGYRSYDDYSITRDEVIERTSSLINYAYINPSVKEYLTDTVSFWDLSDLYSWRDRYYGTAIQLPAVAVEHLFDFELNFRQIFLIRHVWNYIVFLISVFFFYKLCRLFTDNFWISLMGAAMLVLSPRFLAEAFYNIKDIMAMSVLIIAMYFGVLFYREQKIRYVIPLAFATAISTNIRIVTALFTCVCLVCTFIQSIKDGKWKKVFWWCLAAGLFSFGFYVLVSSILWEDVIAGVKGILDEFSNYDTWYGTVYYMGKSYSGFDLPWHYLFVWIGISTPVLYLLLCFWGMGKYLFKTKQDTLFGQKSIFFISILIPLLYVVVKSPILYNGWRHFYFLYPMILLFAVLGFQDIGNVLAKRRVLLGTIVSLFLVYLSSIGFWIVKNHPYEYVYFNRLARGVAEEYFEKDYWAASEYQALKTIQENDPTGSFLVWTETPKAYGSWLLEDNRIVRGDIQNSESLDYYVCCYNLGTNAALGKYYMFDLWFEKEVDDIPVYGIYKRTYDMISSSRLVIGPDDRFQLTKGNHWEKNSADTGVENILDEPVKASMISVSLSDVELAKGIKVVVYTPDGEANHYTIADTYAGYDDTGIVAIRFSERMIHKVDIIFPEEIESNEKQNLECEVGYYNMRGVESSQENIITGANANYRQDDVEKAFDKNTTTTWSSGISQENGMHYEFSLAQESQIDIVELNLGTIVWDYPRGLEIYVSKDGSNWEEIHYTTEDNQYFTLDKTVECKYVRLFLAGEESVSSNWTIGEIRLYRQLR